MRQPAISKSHIYKLIYEINSQNTTYAKYSIVLSDNLSIRLTLVNTTRILWVLNDSYVVGFSKFM